MRGGRGLHVHRPHCSRCARTLRPVDATSTRIDIIDAHRRIAADVRRTPLMRLPGAALGVDCAEVWLKLEHLQLGGSFKARGMFNRMRSQPIPPPAS